MKKKIFITLATVLTTVVVASGWWLSQQHKISRFLPPEATDIKEAYIGSIDFAKYMKAKVSEEGFHTFRKRIGYSDDNLIAKTSKENFSWSSGSDPVGDWWDPGKETDGSYGRYNSEEAFYSMTKYENGHVYFIAQKW